jgi:hypothetical protein
MYGAHGGSEKYRFSVLWVKHKFLSVIEGFTSIKFSSLPKNQDSGCSCYKIFGGGGGVLAQ